MKYIEAEKWFELANKHNVCFLKVGNLEVHFRSKDKPEVEQGEIKIEKDFETEDDLLFYSAT